jgi:crossover junction endodeoxyribonuclease RuvC
VLLSIYQNVLQLLSDHKPGLVILEQTSSFAGGFVTGQVSQCIGVILLVCLQNNIDVVFVYPTHVKATVVGKGKASKSQVKKSVTNVLYVAGFDAAVKFSSEHAADALANVFCYLSDAKMITLPEPLFKPVKRRKKNGK